MDRSVTEELIRLANEWDSAMVENDAEAIGQYMADDWTIVGSDGRVGDKATFLALVKSGTLSHDVMESDDLTVRVYGDTAVVTARGVSGGKYQGLAFREVERSSSVFVRQAGQWRCVLTHLSRIAQQDDREWAGIHHVALVTPDLDATIAFYGGVLGMQIGDIRTGGGVLPARHCFIRPGAAAPTWGLHFFEHADATIPQYSGGIAGLREAGFVPGAFQHIAFALPDAAASSSLRQRLEAHGVAATPTGRIGPIENMLFFDNIGLLLEATWPSGAAAGR